MKALATTWMQWPSRWKPFATPRDLEVERRPCWSNPNTEPTTRRSLYATYGELQPERLGGIHVLLLGVKGLISCSWFEEHNCFCVCSDAAFCRDEPPCWKPLENTSGKKWSVSPRRSLSDVCSGPPLMRLPPNETLGSLGCLQQTPVGLWSKSRLHLGSNFTIISSCLKIKQFFFLDVYSSNTSSSSLCLEI